VSPGDDGCATCFPADAARAWEARSKLRFVADLVDESHYHVMVLACDGCGQRFISIFTETIDWNDGDDPQYWEMQPITAAESESLASADALEEGIAALPARRSLYVAHPSGLPQTISWSRGVRVGFHD